MSRDNQACSGYHSTQCQPGKQMCCNGLKCAKLDIGGGHIRYACLPDDTRVSIGSPCASSLDCFSNHCVKPKCDVTRRVVGADCSAIQGVCAPPSHSLSQDF